MFERKRRLMKQKYKTIGCNKHIYWTDETK